MVSRSRHVVHYFWALFGLWTVVIFVLLLNEYRHQEQSVRETAAAEAMAYLNKEQATRMWAADRGAVYVPITAETPPNPYLSHLPERDIKTPGGQRLTLMNPAYFTRHIMDQYAARHNVRGHLTSLDPIRPETAPDIWERSALLAFEEGVQEVMEVSTIDDRPYLRVMKPLVSEAQCLKCHAAQGDAVGHIRGGISVALPMDAYRDQFRKNLTVHGLSLGILWLLGAMGLGGATWKLSRVMRQHDQAEFLLRANENQLNRLLARLFEYQEIERKSVALEIHEEIAQSLAAVKLRIAALLADPHICPAPLSDHIMAIAGQIDTVVQMARQVTKRVSPIMIDDLGVETAILSLCRDAMRSEPENQVDARIEMDESLIPGDLKIVLYRIVEELISLSTQYCRGGRTAIYLRTSDGNLVLEMALGGITPELLTTQADSELSIAAIRNRATSSGAEMMLESDPKGTITIKFCWSLRENH